MLVDEAWLKTAKALHAGSWTWTMLQVAIAESAEVRRCLIGSLTVILGDGLPGQPIGGLDCE